jgi:hypothetical protein
MSAIFDTLEYVKGAKKAGFTEQQAEYQAEQIAIVANVIESDLVTKDYLRKEFINFEQRILIKLGSLMIGMGIYIGFLLLIKH